MKICHLVRYFPACLREEALSTGHKYVLVLIATFFTEVLPPTPGVHKSLEVHKILMTAKSLKSMETTETHTTAPATTGLAQLNSMQQDDIDLLKCLHVENLVASLPIVGNLGRIIGECTHYQF